jgi:hypothetical protein
MRIIAAVFSLLAAPAFADLTPLTVPPGQRYAVIGSTSSGYASTSSLTTETLARIAGDTALGVSTAALESSKVNRAGDTMTGSLTLSATSLLLTGSGGVIASASSVTASGFFGSGYGLFDVVIGTTNTQAGNVNVNSLSFVNVSSATKTLRSGMIGMGFSTIQIRNASGASQDYTFRIQENGVTVAIGSSQHTIANAGFATITVTWNFLTTAGAKTYTVDIKSTSASTVQQCMNRSLTVLEF